MSHPKAASARHPLGQTGFCGPLFTSSLGSGPEPLYQGAHTEAWPGSVYSSGLMGTFCHVMNTTSGALQGFLWDLLINNNQGWQAR